MLISISSDCKIAVAFPVLKPVIIITLMSFSWAACIACIIFPQFPSTDNAIRVSDSDPIALIWFAKI